MSLLSDNRELLTKCKQLEEDNRRLKRQIESYVIEFRDGEFNPIVVYSAQMEGVCPYNDCVSCEKNERHCWNCGWNPEVARQRLEKYQYQVETPQ